MEENLCNPTTVIVYVEPVSNILAVTIKRHFLAIKEIRNEQGNYFFWEVVRTVVIAASSDGGVESMGDVVAADK